MKTKRDLPEIEVRRNDIETAIRLLRQRVVTGGYLRKLRERTDFLTASARRKLKRQLSARRQWKAQWQAAKRKGTMPGKNPSRI